MMLMNYTDLSADQKKKANEYKKTRNICNMYTEEELEQIHKIDLYMMMDLDMYKNKEIPLSVLEHVRRIKKREYHPDRSKGPRGAFLLVDKAYNILKDKRLRSIYDSSYFNVEIPEDRIYFDDEFISVFQKCFDTYARFSVDKDIKTLQDDPSDFYKFWKNYKSTRIYISIDDFYKLQKEDRIEYTKNNSDKINKLKNDDIKKLKEIIRICYKRDTRINSIQTQLQEMRITEENKWSQLEVDTLNKFIRLFGKAKKNKWEIITSKLVSVTQVNRTCSEVSKKAEELSKTKK